MLGGAKFDHELVYERLPKTQVARLWRKWRWGLTLERKARAARVEQEIMAAVEDFAMDACASGRN